MPSQVLFIQPGFSYELTYFDNPGTYLPSTAVSWVTNAGKRRPLLLYYSSLTDYCMCCTLFDSSPQLLLTFSGRFTVQHYKEARSRSSTAHLCNPPSLSSSSSNDHKQHNYHRSQTIQLTRHNHQSRRSIMIITIIERNNINLLIIVLFNMKSNQVLQTWNVIVMIPHTHKPNHMFV